MTLSASDFGPYKAHLNGGPFDDDYRPCVVTGFLCCHGGRYELRIEHGDVVDHSSNNWVEFDWVPAT